MKKINELKLSGTVVELMNSRPSKHTYRFGLTQYQSHKRGALFLPCIMKCDSDTAPLKSGDNVVVTAYLRRAGDKGVEAFVKEIFKVQKD